MPNGADPRVGSRGSRDEKGRFLKGYCQVYPSPMKDPEVRKKVSLALKGKHNSPNTEFTSEETRRRNKIDNPAKRPEVRAKISLAHKGKHLSLKTEFKKGEHPYPDTGFKIGEHHSPKTEFKKGHIPWNAGIKNCWDKQMLTKILTRREPNREEAYLIKLFKEYNLPYRFVGDGQVLIGSRSPDFININGKKKLIEFFGEHWHRKVDEQEKRDIYKSYGFDMLAIWGSELKSKQNLIRKIFEFDRGG